MSIRTLCLCCILLFLYLTTSLSAQKQSSDDKKISALQSSPVPADLDEIVSHFFKLLTVGQVDVAYDELLKNSDVARDTIKVHELVDQTKRTVRLYGEIKGTETVGCEHISPSFIRVWYLALHKDFPIRWILTYYKSPIRGWIITNIKFDDRIEEMFSDEKEK